MRDWLKATGLVILLLFLVLALCWYFDISLTPT